MSSDKPATPRRRSSGADRPHQLAGLGIRNFPTTIDQASIDRDHEQEVTLPTKPAYGTYTGNTPSPQTRYSERLGSGGQGNGLMSPPSPGMTYPWAQHGSSMSKFKSQSQVPSSPSLPYDHKSNDNDGNGRPQPTTPTQRFGSFGSSPSSTGIVDAMSRRPTLMRTPPTDHPEFDPQEAEEEGDSILPDLPMSPARFALNSQFPRPDYTFGGNQDASADSGNVFGGGDLLSPGNMSSPRFGTFDPPLTPRNSLPHVRNGSMGGVHGRNSSIGDGRVHARNLSLFFPQPGTVLQAPGSPRRGSTQADAPVTDISGRGHKRPGLGSDGSFTFGRAAVPPPSENGEAKVVGRRGHHHKHSLSHNFFSFLDPTVTNPDLANLDAAPRPMPTNHVGGGGTTSSPNLATVPILPLPISNPKTSASLVARLSSLSPNARATLAFGGAEFVLGAAIWVKGQSVGSVGLTGLGYLVVFDALGVWVKLWSEVIKSGEGSTSTPGRPFGAHRKESMLYFVQSIFLLFSATYIAKEALEIALMSGSGSGGGHSHGHAHGHSHAHGTEGEVQADKPLMLLASGALAVLLSATSLGNHAKLVEAVGPAVMPLRLVPTRNKAVGTGGIHGIADTVDRLVGNPFSLAIFACISVNLLGHLGLASNQVLKLERVMAFVEAGVAFWLAYPSSLVFGQVLLQTAPPEQAAQMMSFKRAISEIKDHPSVLRTNPPHIWQLTPHDPRPAASSQRTPGKSDPIESTLQTCILVADLTVCVRDDLEDKAILNLTRFCYERCSEAIWTKSGRRVGDAMGELTISVKRERELEAEAAEEEKHEHEHDHHHHHHHHHGHHHDHDHGKHAHHDHGGHHAHEHHDHDEKHEHDHHTHHDSCSHAH